jgi:hypothetical protein
MTFAEQGRLRAADKLCCIDILLSADAVSLHVAHQKGEGGVVIMLSQHGLVVNAAKA